MKDGKIEKIGHPRILNYTSHEENFETIEELFALLKKHAELNHCFLKGNVVRPLVKEPRAGTTDPHAPTKLVLLDIDGIKGIDDVDDILGQIKLSNVDYVVQYSSSMGILPERGMSAHVFMLLDTEVSPAILKQYLIQMNLTLPLLRQNLGLTRTYNALRWSLDITTCQNDKLIYIAPPLVRNGVQDNFKGERIQLVKGKRRTLILPEPFPNAENNKNMQEEALNSLRSAMGLPKRPRTQMKTLGTIEYMAKPDKAVLTGVRKEKEFTYLNLNGGDSWGYYHPNSNPTFIFNFKNEPVYKTSELIPDYWNEVRESVGEAKPTPDGKVFLAFRDFKTALYYNGVYDQSTDLLKLAPAKSETQLRHFLQQHDQAMGEFVPDWDVQFNPHMDRVVDTERRIVNTYQPSMYMRMVAKRVTQVPKTVRKIIFHAIGEDEELFDHFMNTLAVIAQYKTRTGTAWIFHGRTGTGKGLMLDKILRPLFGSDNVVTKRMRELDSQFNGFMEKAFIMFVDEAEQSDFKDNGLVNADLKNYITEPRISIRKMYMMPYEVENYMTWILASNKGHVIMIDLEDRRFNVGVYQERKLEITNDEIRELDDELIQFYYYLMTRKADRDQARIALNNPSKQKMILLNRNAIDTAADAILAGNLNFFWELMPQGSIDTLPRFEQDKAQQFSDLVKKIAKDEPNTILREELFILLEYAVGNMPATPAKFSSYLKHHRLHIQPVNRDGKTYRGIPVSWVVKKEHKT